MIKYDFQLYKNAAVSRVNLKQIAPSSISKKEILEKYILFLL